MLDNVENVENPVLEVTPEVASNGKGLLWKPVGERESFFRHGAEYEFIDFWDEPHNIVRVSHIQHGVGHIQNYPLDFFTRKELERLDVWGSLTDSQKAMVDGRCEKAEKSEKVDKPEKAIETPSEQTEDAKETATPVSSIPRKKGQRGRAPNPLYVGIPKETHCSACGKLVKLVPSNIIEKAKILGVTLEELVADYKCRSCGGRLPKGSKQKV